MTLATRCTSCGTAFRVVQDQLKVSDGWVRCGRCAAVFNATESLFDLDALAPAGPTPPPAPPPPPPPPPSTVAAATDAGEAVRGDMAPSAAEGAWVTPTPASDEPGADAAAVVPDPAVEPPRHEPRPEASPDAAEYAADSCDAPGQVQAAQPDAEAAQAGAAGVDAADAAASVATSAAPAAPTFVRKAERAARWQSREARAALVTAALLLAGAAALQAARGFHATIAAQWPQSRSWLDPLCGLAGCEDPPRRRLDALAVESSSLVTVAGTDWTRLTLVLHNRDRARVLLPAVELTLTDAQGAVVARKVLTMNDLGTDRTAIDARSELGLQAVLDPGAQRIVGYTIELFYP